MGSAWKNSIFSSKAHVKYVCMSDGVCPCQTIFGLERIVTQKAPREIQARFGLSNLETTPEHSKQLGMTSVLLFFLPGRQRF
jgi:hypothetical protein